MNLKRAYMLFFFSFIVFSMKAMDTSIDEERLSSQPENDPSTKTILKLLSTSYEYLVDQDLHPLWKPKVVDMINNKIISVIIDDSKISTRDIHSFKVLKDFANVLDRVKQERQDAINSSNHPLVAAVNQVISTVNHQKKIYLNNWSTFKRGANIYAQEWITIAAFVGYIGAVLYTFQLMEDS